MKPILRYLWPWFFMWACSLSSLANDDEETRFAKALDSINLERVFKVESVTPDVALAALFSEVEKKDPKLIRSVFVNHMLEHGGVKSCLEKHRKISVGFKAGVDAWTVFDDIMRQSLWHWSFEERVLQINAWHKGSPEK